MHQTEDVIVIEIMITNAGRDTERLSGKNETNGVRETFKCSVDSTSPKWPSGGIGSHAGLKIQWSVRAVRVRLPPRLRHKLCNVEKCEGHSQGLV